MNEPSHYRVILKFTEDATIKEKQELITLFEIVLFENTNIEWRQMVVDIPNTGRMWCADLEDLMGMSIIEEVLHPETKEPLDHPRW